MQPGTLALTHLTDNPIRSAKWNVPLVAQPDRIDRQARIEARRSHTDQSADRAAEDKDTGRKAKDTKAPGAKRDQ